MKTLKPGLRLKSAVCATEIMVIRAPSLDAVLACGGTDMLSISEAVPAGGSVAPAHAQGTLIGKRYVDALDRVEVLCTRGGDGSLSLDGVAMPVKQAKALPSSD
jgi:hypothetical protein